MHHYPSPAEPPPRRRRKNYLPLVIIALVLVFIACLAAILLWSTAARWRTERLPPLAYEELIFHYSAERDLDPFFVMGLIRAESSFRSQAVSPMGARGLMQIMPSTGAWLAERKQIDFDEAYLFEPAYNIRMGTYYLRLLLNMFEFPDTALAAYNAGMGNVRNWLGDERYSDDGYTLHTIPFSETRAYVERVNRYTEIYRELYS